MCLQGENSPKETQNHFGCCLFAKRWFFFLSFSFSPSLWFLFSVSDSSLFPSCLSFYMFISRILKVLFHECNIKLKTAKLRNDYGNGNIQRNLAKITKIIQTVCCVTNERTNQQQQQQPKRKKFQSFFFAHCLSLVLHFCLQSRPFFHKNINYHIDSVDSTHLDLVGSLEKRHTHTHSLTYKT